jgi:hypothetical protein
LKSANQTANE